MAWRVFGFVCFLFLLVSGKGCGLWLLHFQDFSLIFFGITKTCPFKYIENFSTKTWKFSDKKILIFYVFLLIDCGYSLEPPQRGVLASTHTLFLAEIKKHNVYPCKPQFYCIKSGFKGVKIIQTWFYDGVPNTGHHRSCYPCQEFHQVYPVSFRNIPFPWNDQINVNPILNELPTLYIGIF